MSNEQYHVQMFATMAPTFGISDLDERTAARKVLAAPGGGLHTKMCVIEKLLERTSSKFYVGDEPSVADLVLFSNVSTLTSGWGPFSVFLCLLLGLSFVRYAPHPPACSLLAIGEPPVNCPRQRCTCKV